MIDAPTPPRVAVGEASIERGEGRRNWGGRVSRLVSCAALIVLGAGQTAALQVRVYDPATHDRFSSFPNSPTINPTFLHAGVDLTGVGWLVGGSEPRSLTLVSPKFFVGARHFRPAVGGKLRFVNASGQVKEYTVKANHDILNDDASPTPTDLSLGELVETVAAADGINPQPYLNLATEAAYLSVPNNNLILLGKKARGGQGIANAISDFFGTPLTSGGGVNNTRTIEIVYQTIGGFADDAFAENGDSGSPSLVNVGGQGAIVGIHTAVLAVVGTTTTIDSFVAHPPYVAQMNSIMAVEGYHMTEATPQSVSMTLVATAPPVIRAGYPFSVSFEVGNESVTFSANNLVVGQSLPVGASAVSVTGLQWVGAQEGSDVQARRGGLDAASNTTVATAMTVAQPQVFSMTVSYGADEFAEAMTTLELNVLESFVSWSAGLVDNSFGGDDDLDGLSNLYEYAFGGDPEEGSLLSVEGTTSLLLQASTEGGSLTLSFLRRSDAEARGLTYLLQSTGTLELPASWGEASGEVIDTEVLPLDDGLEKVTLTLSIGGDERFYRVQVELNEEPS